MADAPDSKSGALTGVWVQVPSPVPSSWWSLRAERCQSGRLGTPGERVCSTRVPGVQIPPSPPFSFRLIFPHIGPLGRVLDVQDGIGFRGSPPNAGARPQFVINNKPSARLIVAGPAERRRMAKIPCPLFKPPAMTASMQQWGEAAARQHPGRNIPPYPSFLYPLIVRDIGRFNMVRLLFDSSKTRKHTKLLGRWHRIASALNILHSICEYT